MRGGSRARNSGIVMGNDWKVRRAPITDAESIAAIFVSSRRAAMPYLPILYTNSEVLHWIKDVVLRNSRVILAVSDDRRVGGFASVQDGALEHLYVSPQLQRRGLGTPVAFSGEEGESVEAALARVPAQLVRPMLLRNKGIQVGRVARRFAG